MKCPKCKQQMRRAGKVRCGKVIKQKWLCGKLAGCGHVRLEPLE